MKISQLFGKRAESVNGRSGYVVAVNASANRITSLTCVDENEEEFTVSAKNVKSVKDAIVYSREGGCEENDPPVRLGKPIFDCEGNYIGKLTDVGAEKFLITCVYSGNKKFSADDVSCNDAVIVKNSVRFLKSDVKKDGKLIFKRGTPLTDDLAEKARLFGEYVQTNLKTIT